MAVESGEVTSSIVVVALVTFVTMPDCFSDRSWYRLAQDRLLASVGFVQEVFTIFSRSQDELSEVERMIGGGCTSPNLVEERR